MFVLLLSENRVFHGFLLHPFCHKKDHADDSQSHQSNPWVQQEEKYHHNDFREDVAHHIGQDRHAVFLDKYHVGGEYGTDFPDIAFREISHGHPP